MLDTKLVAVWLEKNSTVATFEVLIDCIDAFLYQIMSEKNAFPWRSELRTFLLISGGPILDHHMAPPYKALIKTLLKVSLDLLANGVPRRIENVYISFFHLTVYNKNVALHDRENDVRVVIEK